VPLTTEVVSATWASSRTIVSGSTVSVCVTIGGCWGP
jgi:hypothetical protein